MVLRIRKEAGAAAAIICFAFILVRVELLLADLLFAVTQILGVSDFGRSIDV